MLRFLRPVADDGSQLEIEQGPDDQRLSVRCGRSQFSLQALPSEDFPDLSAAELDYKFAMLATDLKRLIEKTRFAISTEETRYYLNGIYLHQVEEGGTHSHGREGEHSHAGIAFTTWIDMRQARQHVDMPR